MGKFSAAKIFDAMDQKLQKALNYLIDLLETGYATELMLNGIAVKVVVDPKVGLAFYQNGVYKGGLEIINNKLVLTTTIMKGPESGTKYIIWEDPPGSVGFPELRFYFDAICRGALDPNDYGFGMTAYPSSAITPSELFLQANNYTDDPYNLSNILIRSNVTPYIRMYVVDSSGGPYTYFKATMNYGEYKIEDRTGDLFRVKRGQFSMISLPAHANNAAALAGGLVAGDLYRTGGDPDAVCIVH